MKIFSPKINQKLTAVKVVYWAMLIYMIAALFWWFIALVKQNDTLVAVQLQQITQKPGTTVIPKQTAEQLLKMQSRKRVQYIAEGLTFLALILIGAVYVFRATRRQIRASVQQQAFDLACVCVMAKDHPLANHDLITPALLDNCPMATLFPEHHIANALETAFLQSGHRLNKRIELRTFLPGLPLVEAGFCVMICDMVTAYSHVLLGPHSDQVIIKRFMPSIRSSISLLLPAYMPQALLTQSFSKGLLGAIERMRGEMSSFVEASTIQPTLDAEIQQFETTPGAK